MIKRIASILLVLALCLAAFPAQAFADRSSLKQVVITDTGLTGEYIYNTGGLGLIEQADGTRLLIDDKGTVYRRTTGWMDYDPASGLYSIGSDGYYRLSDGQLVLSRQQIEESVKAFMIENLGLSAADIAGFDLAFLGEMTDGYATCNFVVALQEADDLVRYDFYAFIDEGGLVRFMTPLFGYTSATGYPLSYYVGTYGEGLVPCIAQYHDEADHWLLKWYEGGYRDTLGNDVLVFESPDGRPYDEDQEFVTRYDGRELSSWEAFHNGHATVANRDYLYGLMDRGGNITVPFAYEFLYNEVGEYPAAGLPNGKYGFIDVKGNTVIPFMYEDAKGEFAGAFVVKDNGKFGVVDRENETIVPFEYDRMSSPQGNTVYAIKKGKVYTMGFANAGSGDITADGKWAAHCVFSDVPKGSWYEPHVQAAYDAGIVGGRADGTFNPLGTLRHGEIMVMVANLHSRMKNDHYDFQGLRRAGEHWAGPFWEYCKAEGIIDSRFDGRLDEPVTREEMAYYFAHTL
ncbi:MAG: WG repeat-containing protein, partial [Clostridia bacterium]|nr:WG repeat-containing protein [Clostridia bacterium]